MPYEFFEHRHRFAVWAAARATQRGFATVEMLRDALEASGIEGFVLDPNSLATDEMAFDRHHRDWCRAIMGFLSEKKLANVTFGRAAKLVAVYLKSMIILGSGATSSLAAVAHPPIDRILLRNLASSDIKSSYKPRWRTTNWTTLDEPSYYALISQLKGVLARGEPFWKLEQYWTVIDD
jgi:hypothetical protein